MGALVPGSERGEPSPDTPAPTVLRSFRRAWECLDSNFRPLFAAGLVSLLLAIPITLLRPAAGSAATRGSGFSVLVELTPIGSSFSWLADVGLPAGGAPSVLALGYHLLVFGPAAFGVHYLRLRAVRDEAARAGDVLAPFRRAYLPSVVANVLVGVLVAMGLALLVRQS